VTRRATRRRDQLLQTPSAHIGIQLGHPIAKKLELVKGEPQLLGLLLTDLPEGGAKSANETRTYLKIV
jgi:hypothetical protein